MSIVNQWGRPVSSRNFFKSSRRNSGDRPWEPTDLRDLDDLLPAYDHAVILSASRRLYANSDVIKGAVNQKATWSVGRYWEPIYAGQDTAWGEQASAWLRDQWLDLCNVRGQAFGWETSLYLDSVALDRDGESFYLLSENDDGWPQVQQIPAHRIGNRFGQIEIVKDPRYAGLRLVKGVVLNERNRAVAYQILGDDPGGKGDRIVSARSIRHVFDPEWQEQVRGIPAGQQSLNMMRDALTSHEWEQQALLMRSSVSLLEYNEHGGPDPDDPTTLLGGEGSTSGLTYQEIAPHVRYFRSESGSKLEDIQTDRPGDAWERFQDRIIRSYLTGMDWPFALAWKPEGMNSVIEHAELMKAERAVQDRQSVLEPHAKARITYAVVRAMNLGILPQTNDWWRWSFSRPPRISVSFAKDGRELRAQYMEGHITETQLQGWQGRNLEDHYRERARDAAVRRRIAREISEETGEKITPADMGEPA